MIVSVVTINSDKLNGSEYVLSLVDSIRNISDEMFLCVSQNIEQAFFQKLSLATANIQKYPSYIDINRWKDVILNKLDRENIDFVIFANDSAYGPLYGLESIKEQIVNSKADLWGLTSHGEMSTFKGRKEEKWPRFVQTNFFTINKNLLNDKRFIGYISSLQDFDSFEEASKKFEFSFTEKVSKWGFKWETFIDSKKYENEKYPMSFILFDLYRLISKENYPFIPKVLFDIDYSVKRIYNAGEELRKILEYIRKKTAYNSDYIINDQIARKDPSDLAEALRLYFIGNDIQSDYNAQSKCAIFSYLFYEDLFETSLDYILNVPPYVDIYIASDTEEKLSVISENIKKRECRSKVYYCLHTHKGRDLSAFFVLFGEKILQYDLACFIHDKKSAQMIYSTVGADFCNRLFDSMLLSRNYVENIIKQFENDKYLGLLSPKMVSHGMYFNTAIDAWTICFEGTKNLMEKYGITACINRDNNPISIGSAFWFRPKGLTKLLNGSIDYDDFPDEPLPVDGSFSHFLERLIPYAMSDAGFYSGIMMDEQAALDEINSSTVSLRKILRNLEAYERINTATLDTTVRSLKKLGLKKKKFEKERGLTVSEKSSFLRRLKNGCLQFLGK